MANGASGPPGRSAVSLVVKAVKTEQENATIQHHNMAERTAKESHLRQRSALVQNVLVSSFDIPVVMVRLDGRSGECFLVAWLDTHSELQHSVTDGALQG